MESNYIVIDETLSLNKGYSLIHSFSLSRFNCQENVVMSRPAAATLSISFVTIVIMSIKSVIFFLCSMLKLMYYRTRLLVTDLQRLPL